MYTEFVCFFLPGKSENFVFCGKKIREIFVMHRPKIPL